MSTAAEGTDRPGWQPGGGGQNGDDKGNMAVNRQNGSAKGHHASHDFWGHSKSAQIPWGHE